MKRLLIVFLILTAVAAFSFAEEKGKVIVYYFHGNLRCASCKNIEKYTKEALEKYFFDEIKSGSIDYQIINVEEEGNEHYMQDYELYTKSVVLSKVKDGKEFEYKNLEQVWQHLRSKKKFYEYIRVEIEAILKKDIEI